MTFYPTTEVPYELQMLIDGELDREEKLLWTGRPKSTRFVWRTMPIVLFAIPWTAFAVFWVVMAWYGTSQAEDAPKGFQVCFPLFGVPFILIGLGMLSTPLCTILRTRRTAYALTNQRALIIIQGRQTKIESLESEQLTNITKQIRKDGSGDLIFNPGWTAEIPFKNVHNIKPGENGFFGIPQVNEVEQIIREMIEEDANARRQEGNHE